MTDHPQAAVTVRPSTRAEAGRLAQIYVETWRSTYAGMVPDEVLLRMSVGVQAERWARHLQRQAPREAIMTAEIAAAGSVGNPAVGFASAGPARRAPKDTGEVYTLYVLPEWQGHGAGRALLQAMFQHLRQAGFDYALIWVVAANPARFFYEAMGGERTVERVERMWGVELAETGYRWSLD